MNTNAVSISEQQAESRCEGFLSSLLPANAPVVRHWRALLLAMPQDTVTKTVIAYAQSILRTSRNPDIHRLLLDLVFFEQTMKLLLHPDEQYLFPAIRYVLGSKLLRHTLGTIKPNQLFAAVNESLEYAAEEHERLSRAIRLLEPLTTNPKANIRDIDPVAVGNLVAAIMGCHLARCPNSDPLDTLSSYPLGNNIRVFLNRSGLNALTILSLPGVYCPRGVVQYMVEGSNG